MAGQEETKQETQKEKPDFKDVESGPLDENNRECRDVFCCLIFLINIGGMIYCTIFAYLNGNPNKIYRPIASNNIICGEVGGVAQNFPYVYFYNPLQGLSSRYCLSSCPAYDSAGVLSTPTCFYNASISGPGCSAYTVTIKKDGSWAAGSPPSPYNNIYIGYDTTAVLGRVCVPSVATLSVSLKDYIQKFTDTLQQGSFASLTNDVKNNWQWLLAGVGFAIVLSLLFMFLLRCLVGCIVWLSILGTILLFAGLGVIFLYNAQVGVFTTANLGFLGLPSLAGAPILNTQYYAIYGYVSFGISGFLLILTICCCSRIRLAVAVCKVAGQFILRVCQIMFLPIFLAAILIGMWGCCLVCMIYLLSSTNFTINGSVLFTSVADYTEPSLIRLYYFIFGTLWSNALIIAIGIFTVASSVCMWYYNHGANSELDSPVTRSLRMAFRYHFGSLAFGSFILAVVQFLQMMVEVIKKQAENTGADQNKFFEYAINCARCCLACLERIVQFLNETAYIQIALRGKSFCNAAMDGFQIVLCNGARFLVVAGVGKLIMFIGRILIAVGATAGFYCLITFVPSIKSNIIEPLYLLAIIFIIGFTVGALFMTIYSLAVDTILACFIVDQMNQGQKGSKALYGPSQLNQLLPSE